MEYFVDSPKSFLWIKKYFAKSKKNFLIVQNFNVYPRKRIFWFKEIFFSVEKKFQVWIKSYRTGACGCFKLYILLQHKWVLKRNRLFYLCTLLHSVCFTNLNFLGILQLQSHKCLVVIRYEQRKRAEFNIIYFET